MGITISMTESKLGVYYHHYYYYHHHFIITIIICTYYFLYHWFIEEMGRSGFGLQEEVENVGSGFCVRVRKGERGCAIVLKRTFT